MMVENVLAKSIALLDALIGFDTTSRNSNIALIEFIRDYLSGYGIQSELTYSDDRGKANLFATVGVNTIPGLVFSGHTDVVPVDGQQWCSDPFRMEHRDGRLYGRGSSDMKGFVAVCLASVPWLVKQNLAQPIHFAFSYDEEVGCIGVRRLLQGMQHHAVQPWACIVGEPTEMSLVTAHKGKLTCSCEVTGRSSHSGLPHRGVNAVEQAVEAVAFLNGMARRCREQGPLDPAFEPPYTTVHTGTIQGGTAVNIVPEKCRFEFEFRNLPGHDAAALLRELQAYADERLVPAMKKVDPASGFEWQVTSEILALDTDPDDRLVQLVAGLLGGDDNHKVSYGTEAGLFDQQRISTLVCGPGSIKQAHRPDEFIDVHQLESCARFIRSVVESLAIGQAQAG